MEPIIQRVMGMVTAMAMAMAMAMGMAMGMVRKNYLGTRQCLKEIKNHPNFKLNVFIMSPKYLT
jgi:hypothetical protein